MLKADWQSTSMVKENNLKRTEINNSSNNNSSYINNTATSNNNNNNELFDSLPDEVLLKIFSDLEQSHLATKMAIVCKRFSLLTRDPTLWTDLTLKIQKTPIPLVKRFTMLTTLRLRGLNDRCPMILGLQETRGESAAIAALQNCPKLTEVDLWSIMNLEKLLEAINEFGNNLKKLSIHGWMCNRNFSTSKAFSGFRRLTFLQIPVSEFNRDVWRKIGLNCESLETFRDMKYCKNDHLLAFLSGIKAANTMKNLDLYKIRVTTELLDCIVNRFRLLERLNLTSCHLVRLSLVNLRAISNMSQLRHLYLDGLWNCNCSAKAADFAEALGNMERLEHLGLCNTNIPDDRTMRAIADNCPKLKYLNMSNCYKITDLGVSWVLQKCAKLERLGVYFVTAKAFVGDGGEGIIGGGGAGGGDGEGRGGGGDGGGGAVVARLTHLSVSPKLFQLFISVEDTNIRHIMPRIQFLESMELPNF